VAVGDHRLEVRRVGAAPAAGAPTLVLLHEALGSAGLWRDFPEGLAAATGLPVIAYSRRGFGGSDPRPLPLPLDYLDREADEALPALRRALALDRVVLVGHSDGATIALMHAGGPGAAGVLGVVAMAPHVFVEEITLAGIRAARPGYDQGLRARLARHHGAQTDAVFFGWHDTWLDPAFRDWSVEHRLPRIRCPVLAIQGVDDAYGSPDQVDRVVRQAGGPARALLLPGCGHAPHRERRETVIDAIARFVADTLRG